jgi:hypothetical protein
MNIDTLIQAVEVKRDGDGYWTHPDMPDFDEGDGDKWRNWITNQKLAIVHSSLSDEDDDHPAYMRVFEDGDIDVSDWEPEPPSGDGWFTLSIHDTEDGPYWV